MAGWVAGYDKEKKNSYYKPLTIMPKCQNEKMRCSGN